MFRLALVGIGSGNPAHLTLQAIRTLEGADVILLPRKGADKADLADLRRMIATEILTDAPPVVEFDLPVRDEATPDYQSRVKDWHDEIAGIWAETLRGALPDGGTAALMVWGDPSLYDSTLRIAERLPGLGVPVQVAVVPGITSLQMLTAAHAIPLNTVGGPVQITTGRRLRDHGWPDGVDTVAVMLDGQCSFQSLDPTGLHIWWGAYVGMDQQVLIEGPLPEVTTRIVETRAKARADHGWIMDIYLIRRV
ncbi:precorrin-6A synthase (deacetylating) [Shimia biformata]|uniref:precorrin-6A synthase (deacetylating) n=1 Tax=Shimia biformata TaxID=1294299 RepID=UPI00194DDAFF|nr:precorrin-6A synthase (deacetylating) [Shimia biformata]